VGVVFGALGQPNVIGEIVGGIMLGPSLLGHIAPGLSAQLLPAGVGSFLGIYAQLGVILYLFLVGLELDLSVIRRSGHAALAIRTQHHRAVPARIDARPGLYPVV
jgi:Kef-type K+ transport system membrane component KefB